MYIIIHIVHIDRVPSRVCVSVCIYRISATHCRSGSSNIIITPLSHLESPRAARVNRFAEVHSFRYGLRRCVCVVSYGSTLWGWCLFIICANIATRVNYICRRVYLIRITRASHIQLNPGFMRTWCTTHERVFGVCKRGFSPKAPGAISI